MNWWIDRINPIDKHYWDVLLPGYQFKLLDQPDIKKKFYTNSLLAILELSDGNHKLFMLIDYPGSNIDKIFKDISDYTETYLESKQGKVKGELIFLWSIILIIKCI